MRNIVPFILSIFYGYMAQSQSSEVQKLIDLGRDSVINLALSELQAHGFARFDPASFDRLSVKTNGQELLILFDRSVQYAPLGKDVVHTATVRLIGKSIGWIPMENGGDGAIDNPTFYTYSEADQKAIDLILADYSPTSEKSTFEIFEKDEHYVLGEYTEEEYVRYKVNKITGKKYDEYFEELAPEEEVDSFVEIEW